MRAAREPWRLQTAPGVAAPFALVRRNAFGDPRAAAPSAWEGLAQGDISLEQVGGHGWGQGGDGAGGGDRSGRDSRELPRNTGVELDCTGLKLRKPSLSPRSLLNV